MSNDELEQAAEKHADDVARRLTAHHSGFKQGFTSGAKWAMEKREKEIFELREKCRLYFNYRGSSPDKRLEFYEKEIIRLTSLLPSSLGSSVS